jgi:hypothetical protein
MNTKHKKGDWYLVTRAELEAWRDSLRVANGLMDKILEEIDTNGLSQIETQGWQKAESSMEAYQRSLGSIHTGLVRTIAKKGKPIIAASVPSIAAEGTPGYKLLPKDSKRSKKPE